ncbi:hypothetical protein ACFXDJ_27400 [Streptomyces sp. NPDC059443]|uniref:hypothetical protein n=1 Tax=unclassified Streptomyces TaxID=2593676 RepID=UPI0036A419E6
MLFLRWVLLLGLVLIGCSLGVYMALDSPALRSVDLTVVDEKPNGSCTVMWTDPFGHGVRQAKYLCDAGRAAGLKAPYYAPGSGIGHDTGFVVEDGPDKGELYALWSDDVPTDTWIDISNDLLLGGVFLTIVAAAGKIRTSSRPRSASRQVVRRATRLRGAAALVADDHRLAVAAVREAWAALHREPGEVLRFDPRAADPRTTDLVAALWVLVEAGPQARSAAEAGASLVARLEPLLAEVTRAAGRRQKQRRPARRAALDELQLITGVAQVEGRELQFAQASTDLLRGIGGDPDGLSAWVDFESRPAEYHALLADAVEPGPGTGRTKSRTPPRRRDQASGAATPQ